MTYIKTLIILTGLALLTACAGGVAINSTVINNGSDDLCEANPFATGCTAPTPEQVKTFCGDDGKPTDTKDSDCAPTVIRVCNANVFDTLCPKDPTPTEQKAFCGDDTKTTDTKTNDCAPVVMRVCTNGDIFDDFCTGLPDTDTMRVNACQTHGTDAGGHISCAASLAPSCIITDPFIYAGCKDVAGIAEVRMMYCQTPANAWDAECMETAHGTVNATRVTACQMFGTDTGMGGDDSCAASLASSCTITNPFAHAGCDDVTDIDSGVRTMFCQMPANAWNPKCMDTTHGTVTSTRMTACQMFGTGTGGDDSCATSLTTACDIRDPFAHAGCKDVEGIAGVRTMYCQTPATAWDEECMDTTHGAVDATRMTACQMFGTGMGGDNSCATSLANVCNDIANPFIYEGCDDVAGIDAGVRKIFCETPATAWNPKCMDTTHGAVDATRMTACQMFGTGMGGDDSCAASLASSCTITNPFAHAGCDDVTDIDSGVRTMFCQMPANAWNPKCMDTTHGTVTSTRMTACQMFGTGTGGDDSCATSLTTACDIRDPFAHAGCKDVEGIAGVRTMYCQTPATAWDEECMDTTHGAVDATRMTACQMFGTGMGGDNSCATSLANVCNDIANPFIYEGCDDVAGIDAGVRKIFCETPATAWNPKCMDTTHGAVDATRMTACQMFGTGMGGDDSCAASLASSCTITNPFAHAGCDDVTDIDSGVRTMFCQMPANAWNPKCMDTTHGTVTSTRMTACQMFGTGTGGDNSCATSLATVCNDIANPFIHAGCDDVAGIDDGVRTMYCQTPATAWNPKCMDTTHGAVDATRMTACQMFGTGMGGDNSCATSLANVCNDIANPFIYEGCDDVAGINAGVRKIFCETPATAWNPKCMDTTHGTVTSTRVTACQMFGTNTGTGGDDSCATSLASSCTITNPFAHAGCDDVTDIDSGVRTMYCQMPANAWNPKCMQTTHGAVNTTRVTACQMFGTNTGTGGDNSCATSLATVCNDIANPFIHAGCDDVTDIDSGVRTMFCEMPANAWNPKCMQTTHGAVNTTRVMACQMFGTGTGGDNSCANSLATVCNDIANPFIYEGCDDVAGINAGVRKIFCETPATAWNPKCMDTTHGTVTSTRMTACQMFGTNTGTGGDDSCATSLASSCTITNPFAHAGCDDVTDIDSGVRTMYCQMPANAWNPKCMQTTHGAVNTTRVTACQMFGTNTGTGGDDSCATSLASSCTITNPFIHAGCDDVTDIDSGVRTMYCEMPANAWNPKCMDTTHGTVTSTRVMACQMFGTGMGGDNSCANSLATVCNDIANPFIHAGCDDVAGIDDGVRTMYCEMPANAWNPKCMDTTHGTVTATRGDACLKFGTDTNAGGHASCVGNTLAESSCASNPFDDLKPGCAILTKFEMIVRTYCKPNHLAGCPTATYDAWVASFPKNAPLQNAPLLASNLAPTAGNKFLQGTETGLNRTGLVDSTADSFNFQSATYNGIGFGGNATEGVAFQYGNIGGKRYFYAGLLSGTDLGPPLTEAVTNAMWYGRIVVLQNRAWYLTPAGKIYGDIDLTVNYDGNNNGTIRGSYNEYTVNGTFDSKGIMGGDVTRSKIVTYTRLIFGENDSAQKVTSPPYSFTRRVVGHLTGLVGQTEAVGVFIGQDFTDYDDMPGKVDANLNNFKHRATRAGFAGGFIARSTRPNP